MIKMKLGGGARACRIHSLNSMHCPAQVELAARQLCILQIIMGLFMGGQNRWRSGKCYASIQTGDDWGGGANWILSKSVDTKTSGCSESGWAIYACTKPHSKAPWLRDLRINNAH